MLSKVRELSKSDCKKVAARQVVALQERVENLERFLVFQRDQLAAQERQLAELRLLAQAAAAAFRR